MFNQTAAEARAWINDDIISPDYAIKEILYVTTFRSGDKHNWRDQQVKNGP